MSVKESNRVVYLLGAGASREAGIALTSELLPAASALLRAVRHAQSEPLPLLNLQEHMLSLTEEIVFSPNVEAIGAALEEVLQLQSDAHAILDLGRSPDLEDLAILADSQSSPILGYQHWSNNRLMLVRQYIDLVYGMLLMGAYWLERKLFFEFARRPGGVYRRFANILSPGDAVLTLNYDYLADQEIGAWNTIAGTHRYLRLDYGIPIKRAFGSFTKDFLWTIPIYHLHGSLGWLYCERCRQVTLTIDPNEGSRGWLFTPVAFIGPLAFRDGNPYFRCHCGSLKRPLIVSPALTKRYDNLYIGQLWRRAREELSHADELVCVGCSFRDSDGQLMSLMKWASEHHRGRLRVTVVTFGEDERLIGRCQSIFGSFALEIGGFAKYLDRLQRTQTRKVPRNHSSK